MKANLIAIKWSSTDTKEPVAVLSLDFHDSGLLATAACDSEIQLWIIQQINDNITVRHLATIESNHIKTNVNCIRFSPCGQRLASGTDRGELFIWALQHSNSDTEKLTWKKQIAWGAHKADIMDLCWSHDGSSIATASVDNCVIVSDAASGNLIRSFHGHTSFVQGVAWDPRGVFLVTQSDDRSCRVYGVQSFKKRNHTNAVEAAKDMVIVQVLYRRRNNPELMEEQSKHQNISSTYDVKGYPLLGPFMFYDEHGPMFRRLAWSPDGSFLAIPAGLHNTCSSFSVESECSTTYLFSRKDLSQPIGQLPALSAPTSTAKWCPMLFKNRKKDRVHKHTASKLHYRMYLAVASSDSVLVYDTESMQCVAFVGGLHLAGTTDLTWSPRGNMVVTCSRDGFCSVISFDAGELGEPLSAEKIPCNVAPFAHHTKNRQVRHK